MTHDIDVLGIGNAIVDMLCRVDDTALDALGLRKSSMQLIDAATADRLTAAAQTPVLQSGGSVANSIAGIASFGGRTHFIGKVASDDLGRAFAHDLTALGAGFTTPPLADGPTTARCLVYVTPDGERTMCTYLGAANRLTTGDIDAAQIARAGIVFLEGYLFDPAEAKQAFIKAADLARQANRKVALSLSDTFCVEGHRADFRALIDTQVDILFANAAEICALFQTSDLDAALQAARTLKPLTIVTRSGDGSVIFDGTDQHTIAAHPVAQVVDTTGAGDLYAAGFLYGLSQGMALPQCGALASRSAAHIIGHIGARPNVVLKSLIPDMVF